MNDTYLAVHGNGELCGAVRAAAAGAVDNDVDGVGEAVDRNGVARSQLVVALVQGAVRQ